MTLLLSSGASFLWFSHYTNYFEDSGIRTPRRLVNTCCCFARTFSENVKPPCYYFPTRQELTCLQRIRKIKIQFTGFILYLQQTLNSCGYWQQSLETTFLLQLLFCYVVNIHPFCSDLGVTLKTDLVLNVDVFHICSGLKHYTIVTTWFASDLHAYGGTWRRPVAITVWFWYVARVLWCGRGWHLLWKAETCLVTNCMFQK